MRSTLADKWISFYNRNGSQGTTTMKKLSVMLAMALLSPLPCYAADSLLAPQRAKSRAALPTASPSAGPSLPIGPSSHPDATANQSKTDLRFVAVEIEGVKFWLGGGDIDVKEFRASKVITFRLLNKLDGEHGFAVDALKIKQIVKPGEEVTLSVSWEDLEQSLSVYRYYCQLHPAHWGGTGVLAGKEGSQPKSASAAGGSSKVEPTRAKDPKDHLAARMGEELPKAESEILKGKLLKIERAFYVIESAPGKEVRVSAPLDPTVDDSGKLLIGEWIETQISSDLHVTSIKKSAARYTVEGDLIKTDGDVYIVADATGNHVALKVTKDTKLDGSYKIGDKIRVEFTPDGYATFIAKRSFPSPSGTEGQTVATQEKPTHPAQEVLKLDRDWAGALVRRDTTLLERAMAEDGTTTAWRNDVQSKPQYLAEIASGDFAFKSIEIDGARARVYGDAALVTGRYTVKGRYKEQDISGQHRYTSLYIKQQGTWRLVSQEIHHPQ
jgi:ketosteroid isomerase-like protein